MPAGYSRGRHELRRWSRWHTPGWLRPREPFYSISPPPGILGMTTRQEQAWLRWYAATRYRAEGMIGESGPVRHGFF